MQSPALIFSRMASTRVGARAGSGEAVTLASAGGAATDASVVPDQVLGVCLALIDEHRLGPSTEKLDYNLS